MQGYELSPIARMVANRRADEVEKVMNQPKLSIWRKGATAFALAAAGAGVVAGIDRFQDSKLNCSSEVVNRTVPDGLGMYAVAEAVNAADGNPDNADTRLIVGRLEDMNGINANQMLPRGTVLKTPASC